MFYLVVLQQVVGPANILVCAACLVLLFFESAFGICIGCKVYNLFNREQAQLCPGGVCDPRELPARHRLGLAHFAVVGLFIAAVYAAAPWVAGRAAPGRCRPGAAASVTTPVTAAEAERCKCPRLRHRDGPRGEVEAAQQLQVNRFQANPEFIYSSMMM